MSVLALLSQLLLSSDRRSLAYPQWSKVRRSIGAGFEGTPLLSEVILRATSADGLDVAPNKASRDAKPFPLIDQAVFSIRR